MRAPDGGSPFWRSDHLWGYTIPDIEHADPSDSVQIEYNPDDPNRIPVGFRSTKEPAVIKGKVSVKVHIDGAIKCDIDFGEDKDPSEVAVGLRSLANMLESSEALFIMTTQGEANGNSEEASTSAG